MSILNKLFGPSNIQADFKKSIFLKIEHKLETNNTIEFKKNGNVYKSVKSKTDFYFDFSLMLMSFDNKYMEDFIGSDAFVITKVTNDNEQLMIGLLSVNPFKQSFLFCEVLRKHIRIVNALENWEIIIYF